MSDKQDRLARIDPATASPEQQAVIARLGEGRGRIPTPSHVWLHSPPLAAGMEAIGTHLNTGGHLSEAEFEVAVLSTAVFWNSPYVVANHARHAVTAGVPEAAVQDILAGRPVHTEDARMQAAADLTAALLRHGGAVEDSEFDAFAKALGREGIAEILVAVGYYTSVALAMRLHGMAPKG